MLSAGTRLSEHPIDRMVFDSKVSTAVIEVHHLHQRRFPAVVKVGAGKFHIAQPRRLERAIDCGQCRRVDGGFIKPAAQQSGFTRLRHADFGERIAERIDATDAGILRRRPHPCIEETIVVAEDRIVVPESLIDL